MFKLFLTRLQRNRLISSNFRTLHRHENFRKNIFVDVFPLSGRKISRNSVLKVFHMRGYAILLILDGFEFMQTGCVLIEQGTLEIALQSRWCEGRYEFRKKAHMMHTRFSRTFLLDVIY